MWGGARQRDAAWNRAILAPGRRLKIDIELRDGYIRAEMRGRDTAEETREFVGGILDAVRTHGVGRILISVRESRALFKVEDWKFSAALEQAIRLAKLKVAFVSDSKEVALSQQYLALLGTQRGLDFRAFESEAEAIAWLQH